MGSRFRMFTPPWWWLTPTATCPRAESDRQRRINEAGAYRAQTLAEAEARSQVLANAAGAERDRLLALAASHADAFLLQLGARESGPALTDFRLFWETIAEVLAGRPKLILEGRAERPQRLIMTRMPLEQAAKLDQAETRTNDPKATVERPK